MPDNARTTLLELDYDPLGGVQLESEVSFGIRAATLAGIAPGLTGPVEWREIPFTLSCSSITFTPPEGDLNDRPAFDG